MLNKSKRLWRAGEEKLQALVTGWSRGLAAKPDVSRVSDLSHLKAVTCVAVELIESYHVRKCRLLLSAIVKQCLLVY